MKRILIALLAFCLPAALAFSAPIKALLITGGCCHDYIAQEKILTEGLSARANIKWTICQEAGTDEKTHRFSVYETNGWAKPYDVIVHNECSGMISNVAFVDSIARAHSETGVGAVVIHCSIHSYRWADTDEWRKLLGVSSYRHQAKRAFDVIALKPEHPIMRGFPLKWHDHPDELYEIKKVWPTCTPLAASLTPGKPEDQHPSIWVNQDGKARVFGTTLGHGPETMSEKVYLDLVARGLLWACNQLDDEGNPKQGYGPR